MDVVRFAIAAALVALALYVLYPVVRGLLARRSPSAPAQSAGVPFPVTRAAQRWRWPGSSRPTAARRLFRALPDLSWLVSLYPPARRAAALPATARPPACSGSRPLESGIPLGLFLLALVLRWWNLPAQATSLWAGEAQVMVEARTFIDGTYTSPFTIDLLGLPALYGYLLSLPLRLAGSTDVNVARGFTAVYAALGVPLLYLVARELGYARRTGAVAAFLLATLSWHLVFSRLALQNVTAATAACFTLLMLIIAVRRASLLAAVACGVGVAWTFNADLSGWLVLPVVILWFALVAAGYNHWGSRSTTGTSGGPASTLTRISYRAHPVYLLHVAAVLSAAALLCSWPLIENYLSLNSPLAAHTLSRFILSTANRTAFAAAHPEIGSAAPAILWYQFKATVPMFFTSGAPDGYFNVPGRAMLDPLAASFFAIGVLGLLWCWRRPSATLVLLWLVVPIFLGVTLSTGSILVTDVPSETRCLAVLPAICLTIAVGLEYVGAGVCVLVRRFTGGAPLPAWWDRAGLLTTIIVATSMGSWEVQWYWDFADSPLHAHLYQAPARDWSSFVQAQGMRSVAVVAPDAWPVAYNALYAPEVKVCAALLYSRWATCPPVRMVIFDDDQKHAALYGTLTHTPIEPGPSSGAAPTFWYASGTAPLPDPAGVLRFGPRAVATSRPAPAGTPPVPPQPAATALPSLAPFQISAVRFAAPATPGEIVVAFHVTLVNDTHVAQSYDFRNFSLQDPATGALYQPQEYAPLLDSLLLTDVLGPGANATGDLAFEVPSSVTDLRLWYNGGRNTQFPVAVH